MKNDPTCPIVPMLKPPGPPNVNADPKTAVVIFEVVVGSVVEIVVVEAVAVVVIVSSVVVAFAVVVVAAKLTILTLPPNKFEPNLPPEPSTADVVKDPPVFTVVVGVVVVGEVVVVGLVVALLV